MGTSTGAVHWLDSTDYLAPTVPLPVRFLLRVHVGMTSLYKQRCF